MASCRFSTRTSFTSSRVARAFDENAISISMALPMARATSGSKWPCSVRISKVATCTDMILSLEVRVTNIVGSELDGNVKMRGERLITGFLLRFASFKRMSVRANYTKQEDVVTHTFH